MTTTVNNFKVPVKQLLAKSKNNITLGNHTKEALSQLKILCSTIESLNPNQNLLDNILLELSIAFHDVGKVLPSFQVIVGNKEFQSPDMQFPCRNDVPHSLFSIFLIDLNKLAKLESFDHEKINLLLSSVAFHHWRDNFLSLLFTQNDRLIELLSYLNSNQEVRDWLVQNLKEEFIRHELENYSNLIGYNEDFARSIEAGVKISEWLYTPTYSHLTDAFGKSQIKNSFGKRLIINLGLLIRVDQFVSYIQEESITAPVEIIPPTYDLIKQTIEKNFKKKGITPPFWQLEPITVKPLQQSGDNQSLDETDVPIDSIKYKNIVLVAPTGSGKTEFAYLWGAGSKLFFTLPLRSAVNAMYERSTAVFGIRNTGLLHSDADVYLGEFLSSSKHESDNPTHDTVSQEVDCYKILDLSKQLSLPMLVTTGDQIFPAALKYPGYERVYSTLSYSKLVIDEVQAYDPVAVAVILKLIEDVTSLGGNFLLMTATLPTFVKEEIEKRVKNEPLVYIDLYEKKDLLCSQPKHKVQLRNTDISDDDVVEEIIARADRGNRVLVILNTVEKAQEVYSKVKELLKSEETEVCLLHSKFTYEDRRNKEDYVLKSFSNPKPQSERSKKILIATQVVEASLDIDADVLYTELAPIDALVQRIGRVLRRIRTDKDFTKVSEKELRDINVYIFCKNEINVEKGDISLLFSGARNVYSKDLLLISLTLLIDEALETTNLTERLIQSHYFDQFDTKKKDKKTNSKENKKDKTPDTKNQIYKDLYQSLSVLGIKPFELPELRKKKLVEKLYDLLFKTSEEIAQRLQQNQEKNKSYRTFSYVQDFIETISTLDAGYSATNKNEAIRIFRRISLIPVIPSNLVEKFKKSLEDFIARGKLTYINFKVEVLGKYIVHVQPSKDLEQKLTPLYHKIYEIPSLNDDEVIKKVKRWLSDIYELTATYNEEKGLTLVLDKNECESNQI